MWDLQWIRYYILTAIRDKVSVYLFCHAHMCFTTVHYVCIFGWECVCGPVVKEIMRILLYILYTIRFHCHITNYPMTVLLESFVIICIVIIVQVVRTLDL